MVQGEGIAVHVRALSLAGAAVRDYFGEEIDVGDLYALNDPISAAATSWTSS